MNIKLSDNIRELRKAHSLTQQQLADALGVTVGAVYKWEAKLSSPDLNLLIELADLFDTSVDVLLGYEVKNNKQDATVTRLKEYFHRRDKEGLAEAEKALIRYPNSFGIVYQSAMLYYGFGITFHDGALLRRSIELMERAIPLLGQNDDPEISELSIIIDMANAWSCLGDHEKMLELLKKDNPRGINNDMIGLGLAVTCNRPDEAVSYLSAALVDNLTALVRIVIGYVNVYFKRKDFASGAPLLRLTLGFLTGFKDAEKSNLLDKPCATFYVCLALANLELVSAEEAYRSLQAAKELAAKFDQSPDYSANSLRYTLTDRRYTAYDDLGETAAESILRTLRDLGSKELKQLWEEISHEE